MNTKPSILTLLPFNRELVRRYFNAKAVTLHPNVRRDPVTWLARCTPDYKLTEQPYWDAPVSEEAEKAYEVDFELQMLHLVKQRIDDAIKAREHHVINPKYEDAKRATAIEWLMEHPEITFVRPEQILNPSMFIRGRAEEKLEILMDIITSYYWADLHGYKRSIDPLNFEVTTVSKATGKKWIKEAQEQLLQVKEIPHLQVEPLNLPELHEGTLMDRYYTYDVLEALKDVIDYRVKLEDEDEF